MVPICCWRLHLYTYSAHFALLQCSDRVRSSISLLDPDSKKDIELIASIFGGTEMNSEVSFPVGLYGRWPVSVPLSLSDLIALHVTRGHRLWSPANNIMRQNWWFPAVLQKSLVHGQWSRKWRVVLRVYHMHKIEQLITSVPAGCGNGAKGEWTARQHRRDRCWPEASQGLPSTP